MEALDTVPRTSINQRPGGGTDYPFLVHETLTGVVLDAYLSYDDAECDYVLPFRLELSGDAWTVYDADLGVVADGTISGMTTRTWGTRTVYEQVDADFVFRMVAQNLTDGTGVLDPRTCNRLPARVKSLRVGLVRQTQGFKFEAGFNIDMSGNLPVEPTDGGRYRSQINIDAVAGAGAGRVNGCEELTPQVRKINQQGPDCSGNFKIEVDPCFRAGPPLLVTGDMDAPRTAIHSAVGLTQEEAQHALRLTSDCRPCCECDYFVRTYRGLKRQWEVWRAVAAKSEGVRDVYESNRDRWNLSRECRINNPARLVLNTDFLCKTFIGGSFCNFTSCCLTNIEIRFTLRKYKGSVLVPWAGGSPNEAYISGSPTDGDERYAPLVNTNVVRFFLDFANPQDSSVAKFKFCSTECKSDESLEATMTVHVPDAGPNPENGDSCEMATVTVPAEIQTIWNDLGLSATPTVRALLTKTAALNPGRPTFNCEC